MPAGVHVDSVRLVLYVNRTQDVQLRSFTLHRVLAAWGEGTSNAGGDSISPGGGQGAPATLGDATWSFRICDAQHWAQSGGDFDPAPLAATLVSEIGPCASDSTPALVAEVQRWVDGGDNFGWLLVGAETVNDSARRFAARHSAIACARPLLVICFTPSAVVPVTWLGLKAALR